MDEGVWQGMGKLITGDFKTGKKGKNSLFVPDHDKIQRIPTDQMVTYANIVLD